VTARLGYVPALDGLRGIAIAMVVAYHAFGWPLGGWLGVQLFFVLSGFLITTLLLEEHAATGAIRFGAFYARRARRLFPALAVVLSAYLMISAARGVDGVGQVARWGLYVGNAYAAFWPVASQKLVGLNHLWSLAQEEQFYLAWPAVLLVVRKARNPMLVLATLVVALIVYRDVLVQTGASDARVYFAPDTNLDGLLLGAALAFQLRRRPFTVPRRLLVGAVIPAVLIVALIPSTAGLEASVLPLFEGATVLLIAAAVTGRLWLPRALVWLGGISYALYLWHGVVLWAFHFRHPVLAVAVSIALSYASTTWIERPLRAGVRRRPFPVLRVVASSSEA